MPQTGEQCLAFLEKAREAVSELSVAEDSERQMEQDCQRLEREIEAEQKQMADAVQATVKKRRQEISASYDAEINKAQDLLKKARVKREKAKSQGVAGDMYQAFAAPEFITVCIFRDGQKNF